MKSMFKDSVFNRPIAKWNTINVRDMSHMFDGSLFNGFILWNVRNVKDMSYMFANTNVFNRELPK